MPIPDAVDLPEDDLPTPTQLAIRGFCPQDQIPARNLILSGLGEHFG